MHGNAGTRRGRSWIPCALSLALLLVSTAVSGQEQRFLRHILVRTEADVDRLIQQLDGGADFKSLARRHSLDHVTKMLGGDLGWVSRGTDPQLYRSAFGIEKEGGYVKARTQWGWHVVQYVESRGTPRPAPPPPPGPVTRPAGKDPATGKQPREPTGEVERPSLSVPVQGIRNEDLSVELRYAKVAFLPEEKVGLEIEIRNNTDRPIQVFNPELWPLGMIARFQFGRLNRTFKPITPPGEEPADGLFRELGASERLARSFIIQDYTGDLENWPIIRTTWQGAALFSRLEKHFPQMIEHADYRDWKARWRYYSAEGPNLSILPAYRAEDRWFVCIWARGQLWVELEDPGLEGLIPHWISQVRQGIYDRVSITRHVPGRYLATVGKKPRWDRSRFPYRTPANPPPLERGVVALGIERDREGQHVGNTVHLALEDAASIRSLVVPVGRIVLDQNGSLAKVAEGLEQKKPMRFSLVLAYPYELLPDKARIAIDAGGTPAGAESAPTTRPAKPAGEDPSVDESKPVPASGAPPKMPRPLVRVETEAGSFLLELFEDEAPNTVANFISLAEAGFYDGLTFHRKLSNDTNPGIVQGGSPDGTVMGHPGYFVPDEVNKQQHARGTISLARRHVQPNTGGSQFFISLAAQPHFDEVYTVFGRVIQGIEVVQIITPGTKMISVKVTRKRDHAYEPRKLPVP